MTYSNHKKIGNRLVGILVVLCLILIIAVVFLAMFILVVVQVRTELENINISNITDQITEGITKMNINIKQGMGNIDKGLNRLNVDINRIINKIPNDLQDWSSILSVLTEIQNDGNGINNIPRMANQTASTN